MSPKRSATDATEDARGDASTRARVLAALDADQIDSLRADLLDWFEENKRDLPWRQVDDPYAIWVSEVMLQQTQVATVKDYYTAWMDRFPDIASLAQTPLSDVLELWAGLGYYRRVKLLHRAAIQVHEELDGDLPETAKSLAKLPGIGRYTAGAIASIAFGERAPLVDGNVERVFARLFAIPGDPKARENQKLFWEVARELVSPDSPGDFNQSLMELGATVCSPKKPTCLLCPVRTTCLGFASGSPTDFPAKVKRKKPEQVDVASIILLAPDPHASSSLSAFLARRPGDGLLPDLLEFPTSPTYTPRKQVGEDHDWAPAIDAILSGLDLSLPEGLGASEFAFIGATDHTFSHLKMRFHAFALELPSKEALLLGDDTERERAWRALDTLDSEAIPSAQRKVEALMREWLALKA